MSCVRHPDIHRTYATPFLQDSHQWRKLPETIFLMVIILNRHEIPHHLDSPHVVPTYGQMSLRHTDHSRTTN